MLQFISMPIPSPAFTVGLGPRTTRRPTRARFFEGEDSGNAGGTQSGGPPPPTPPTPTPAPAPAPQGGAGKLFTQDDVNRMNAEEKRKWLDKNREMAERLERIQNDSTTTSAQKATLETEIETLKATYRTNEETMKLDRDKLQKKYDRDVEGLRKESDTWRSRHDENMCQVSFLNAASEFKAYNPQQIAAILAPTTKVVEVADSEGKLTGRYEPVVDFIGRDKDGNSVKLKLSVRDAVKHMTEMPDQYGNLFRSTANGGVGANPVDGNGSRAPLNIDSLDINQYRANRDKIREQVRQQQAAARG